MTETGDAERWQAVAARNRAWAGLFVYAVRSTGIYCAPGCPARLPRRENVTFFTDTAAARAAGFRPCRRCDPDGTEWAMAAGRGW